MTVQIAIMLTAALFFGGLTAFILMKMEIDALANLILNNSIAIAVVAFFMYRDLKFMNQLQQTLQALVDAVDSLKQVIALDEGLDKINSKLPS